MDVLYLAFVALVLFVFCVQPNYAIDILHSTRGQMDA
jgi:hypothetical protein